MGRHPSNKRDGTQALLARKNVGEGILLTEQLKAICLHSVASRVLMSDDLCSLTNLIDLR